MRTSFGSTAQPGQARLRRAARAFIAGLSCPSSTFCVAMRSDGEASLYDGTSWSAPATMEDGVVKELQLHASGVLRGG